MNTSTKPTSNLAENGNKSKPLLSVVFFAHFKSTNSESHRMERFFEEKQQVIYLIGYAKNKTN